MTTLVEHQVELPLAVALGDRVRRRAVLIEGPEGWGEWSPLPGHPADPATCRRAAEEAASVAFPPAVRDRVEVNALVPAVGPDQAAALAAAAVAGGYRTLKVKVGDAGGLDRVAAVRAAAGPGVALRVDANGAWPGVDEAVAAVAAMARYDLELVEQPVAGIDDLARVRAAAAVAVAADECVQGVADARRVAAVGAADVLVVKVQALGGIASTLAVIEAAGLPVIVTSMFETSVGLAAGLALAAALDDLPFACGLGTAGLLAADVVADPLVAVAGALEVRRPRPDPALLARYRVVG